MLATNKRKASQELEALQFLRPAKQQRTSPSLSPSSSRRRGRGRGRGRGPGRGREGIESHLVHWINSARATLARWFNYSEPESTLPVHMPPQSQSQDDSENQEQDKSEDQNSSSPTPTPASAPASSSPLVPRARSTSRHRAVLPPPLPTSQFTFSPPQLPRSLARREPSCPPKSRVNGSVGSTSTTATTTTTATTGTTTTTATTATGSSNFRSLRSAGTASTSRSDDTLLAAYGTYGTYGGRLDRCRSYNRTTYGVFRHIHEKQHKQKVKDELMKKLYELRKDQGYTSDYETFRGYMEYKARLEELQKGSPLFSTAQSKPLRQRRVSSSSKVLLDASDDAFFERAIEKAKKTLESPRPPKPFLPSLEQLRITSQARDDAIHSRLHPKRPGLPSSLPPEAQSELEAILKKSGVVSKAGKEQVSDKDLLRLRPGQWLNDELINFYGQLILDRAVEGEAAKENAGAGAGVNGKGKGGKGGKGGGKVMRMHYFNTFFWTKLLAGYEKGRLAKWTKKLDIFSKDIILVPVNHNNSHWTAAAINFRRKRIESYDSMNLDRSDVCERLRTYLDEEHKNKKKKPFDFTGWEDHIDESIPQQENGFDCGVFTCQFLETLSRGEESFGFSQRDMPYLRQRMTWEIGRGRLHDVP